MIQLYADENVDRRITAGLRRRGVDVETAQGAGLTGRVPDELQLRWAVERERALLTGDRDLLAIADQWTSTAQPFVGVIYYHPRWTTVGHVVHEVHAMARSLDPEHVRSRIIFVSWDRRRRR